MAIVSLSQTFVKQWAAINTADLLFSLMIKTVSKNVSLQYRYKLCCAKCIFHLVKRFLVVFNKNEISNGRSYWNYLLF